MSIIIRLEERKPFSESAGAQAERNKLIKNVRNPPVKVAINGKDFTSFKEKSIAIIQVIIAENVLQSITIEIPPLIKMVLSLQLQKFTSYYTKTKA